MIRIDLSINTRQVATGPLAKVVSALERIKRLQDEVNAGFGRMANQLQQVANASQGVKAISARSSSGGQRASSGPGGRQANPMDVFHFYDRMFRASRGTQYGMQRQQAFQRAYGYSQQQLQSGQAAGWSNMGKLMHSQRTMPQQKTSGQLWMDVIKTSRFGGGAASPLVGRTASAAASSMGMGAAAAGPIGIAIAAALAVGMAAKALAEQFVAAAQYLRDKVSTLSITGSNASVAGFGLSGGSRGGAEAVKAAIQGGGMGAARAAAAGIPLNLGSRGNNDYGEALRKARAYVASSKTFDEARRRAEDLGIPDAASSYYLNDRQKAALSRPGGAADAGTMKLGSQLSFEMDATAAEFEKMRANMLKPLMEWFVAAAPSIRTTLTAIGWLGRAIMEIVTFVPRLIMELSNWIREKLGFEASKSTDANTKALEENTREMKRGRDVRGGGPRGSSATPSKTGGNNWGPNTAQQLGVGLGI